MGPWLLSIAGIIVVGVIVELLLNDSPTSKFIRSIYGFFVLLVIVSPLPAFFQNGIEIGGRIEYNWDMLNAINTQNNASATARIERALAQNNFEGAIVIIWHNRDSPSFQIDRIFINAIGTERGRPGINPHDEIIRIVTAVVNVPAHNVEVLV